MGGLISLAKVGTQVIMDFTMICALDYAPDSLRRSVLKAEYEGEDLEKRLAMKIGGGWKMLSALWRMSLVNMRPALAAGDKVLPGEIRVSRQGGADLDLCQLMREGVPLVINFGSCS